MSWFDLLCGVSHPHSGITYQVQGKGGESSVWPTCSGALLLACVLTLEQVVVDPFFCFFATEVNRSLIVQMTSQCVLSMSANYVHLMFIRDVYLYRSLLRLDG